jgi:hypothetical protein
MKLNYILALATFLAAGTTAVNATAIPVCSTTGTLATYEGYGETGCLDGDKIFSDFAYTAPTGDPIASNIAVGVDDNAGLNQYGLQFQSTLGVWNASGFVLSYTATVDTAICPQCLIIADQSAFQGALAPNNAAMTVVLSGAGTINLNDLTTNANTEQISFPGVTSTNIAYTGTAAGASDPIDTFGGDVYQVVTPEPGTLGLAGAALLGLGLLGRKKVSRQ